MLRDKRELWWAAAAVLLITLVYVAYLNASGEAPASGSLFGHMIGVIGFILMLSTETLYSIRKRSRLARWGRMAAWLRIHIFTGLVGPYMVLLHSSWKFNGLAGIVLLLTVIIVVSGFIGRYIYTSVPRSADGIALEAAVIQRQIDEIEAQLERFRTQETLLQHGALVAVAPTGIGQRTKPRHDIRTRRSRKEFDGLSLPKAELRRLKHLERQHSALKRQINSLAVARRMLSVWHAVHIPIGVVLFTSAFFHVIAALYFATLLK